ncbi:MAG TPA: 2Fe-2S iron-sulfur cluster-binding protein [Xanthobacteraceae bacterium]|nr:2Fe-2S iron-sulfur cluster-binding protein [Xanthobacteraceae bacterium]
MPSITFVHPDGLRETLDVPVGTTIMHAAVAAGLGGIVGECGGSAMCATCHVYVDQAQQEARSFPAVSAVEDAMLDSTVSERKAESRLSCQLSVAESFEGLELHLPEMQV